VKEKQGKRNRTGILLQVDKVWSLNSMDVMGLAQLSFSLLATTAGGIYFNT